MKDAVGNELKVGDLVAIQLARPLIYGRIAEIAEGGIITGTRSGQERMQPTKVVIVSNHNIEAHPHQVSIGEVLCLRDDNTIAPVVAQDLKESERPN